ncbi:DUF2789 family protein [Allohahella sp. A8]|uniref:DUF2789 family protein n=1 Tax=Allohahella sp. A8 TaxID=3141461 RepID=UPI000C09FEC5|nr:hypothetical protein [Hahellaceae bacterium]|tara:strand:+ start:71223 stop:71459 length:237 start_codon:yes stop_codon:yes gene_type:complete
MDTSTHHTINGLFEQLGLDSSDAAIDAWIREKRPLDKNLKLADAEFWNKSQAAFLSQAWLDDAEWVVAMDELSTRLRG